MLQFRSGPPPKGFKKDFESFLFNTLTHRQTQAKTRWKEFHLLDKDKKQIIASVAIHVQGKEARSPLRAPFGSYEVSPRVKIVDFRNFISQVEAELKKLGVKNINLITPPSSYALWHNFLVGTLLAAEYSPTRCDLSCSIPVDEVPLVRKMNKAKRKQFRHGVKLRFAFKKIPNKKLKEVYYFIESCRHEREQSLSLTYKQLQKIVNKLSKTFLLSGVYFNKHLVAASICVRINKSILYTFYSAHKQEFDHLSPLVFLLSHLYDWCHDEGVSLLDMGTSTLNNKPNFNLLDFKLRVGGEISPKFTFQKILA